jgi:hypothetical protein
MSNLYHPKQRRILADIVGRARYKKCRCEPVRAVLTNERDAFKPFSWMNRETRKWAGLYHASGGAECDQIKDFTAPLDRGPRGKNVTLFAY